MRSRKRPAGSSTSPFRRRQERIPQILLIERWGMGPPPKAVVEEKGEKVTAGFVNQHLSPGRQKGSQFRFSVNFM